MDHDKIQVAVMVVAAAFMIVIILVTDDYNHFENHILREAHMNRDYEKELYMNRVLYSDDTYCINQIWMPSNAFLELCKVLSASNLCSTTISLDVMSGSKSLGGDSIGQ